MLEHCADSKHSSVVSWSEDGKSFAIHKKDAFMKYVVPLFFKQNLFRSFVSQNCCVYDIYIIVTYDVFS